jgi:drug/metabolite transporter (DMT)-like permease
MSAPAVPIALPRPADPALAGIGFAIASFMLFTCGDVAVKWLSGGYPVYAILFFNACFAMLVALGFAWRTGGARQFLTCRVPLHLLRGLVSTSGSLAVFFAYSRLPLADAYAILFCAPLLITALAMPILKEKVGWRRWIAVLAGFGGVLVMLRPGAGMLDIGALGALYSAAAYAFTVLLVRRLGPHEPPAAFPFYGNLMGVIVGGTLVLFFGAPWPTLPDLGLFALAGSLGVGGFICTVNAYRRSPAAMVAPFQYTQMAWGTLAGWTMWHQLPDAPVLIGAAIVVASGLYILQREASMRRRPQAALAAGAGAAAAAAASASSTEVTRTVPVS